MRGSSVGKPPAAAHSPQARSRNLACTAFTPNQHPRPLTSLLQVNARVSNRQIFSQYKFCLAPEQGLARDFFTGAVYEQLLAGCVPIYLGASNVNDFVPGNSVVSIADYDSVEEMMEEVARWGMQGGGGARGRGAGRVRARRRRRRRRRCCCCCCCCSLLSAACRVYVVRS